MAEVNPPLNLLNAPDYTRRSQPINVSDPIKPTGQTTNTIMPHGVREGDRSGEFQGKADAAGLQADAANTAMWGALFQGIGKGVDQLTKIGDTLIKKDIENTVYAQANAEREGYTDYLENLRNRQGGIQSVIESTGTSSNVPAELKSLPKSVESLAGANAAGKISHTMYIGKLNSLAKDLRARYPGYRAYIDQQFASVTGMNPANAYIESLTKDLNANAQAATQSRGKVESLIIDQFKENPESAQVAWELYSSGKIDSNGVMKILTPHLARKADMEYRRLRRADAAGNREDVSLLAEEDLSVFANRVVSTAIENFKFQTGANTTEGLETLMQRMGEGRYSQEQRIAIAQQLRSQLPIMLNRIRQQATETRADGSPSLLSSLKGGQETLNKITSNVVARYEGFIDAVEKGDFALASYHSNLIKGMNADASVKVLKHPSLGPKLLSVNAVRQAAGDNAMGDLAIKLLGSGFTEDLKVFYNQAMSAAVAQPGKASGEVPITIKDVLREGRSANINSPKLNQKIIQESVAILNNPKLADTGRENVADFLFAPENRGFLNSVNADGRTSTGQIIPGKWYTFRDMTSKETTDTISKMSDRVKQNYRDWTQMTFRDIFLRDIMDLNQYQGTEGIRVSWDSKNKKLNVDDTQPIETSSDRLSTGYATSAQAQRNQALRNIRERVRVMNMGFASLAEAAEVFGTEPEAFIMRTLLDAGYKPTESSAGFPQDIMQGIINSRLKSEEAKRIREQQTKDFEGR